MSQGSSSIPSENDLCGLIEAGAFSFTAETRSSQSSSDIFSKESCFLRVLGASVVNLFQFSDIGYTSEKDSLTSY